VARPNEKHRPLFVGVGVTRKIDPVLRRRAVAAESGRFFLYFYFMRFDGFNVLETGGGTIFALNVTVTTPVQQYTRSIS